MTEPTIALVFSPEPWVEHLHRHLADHGGARVREIVLDPTLGIEDSSDCVVVSDRWPGLDARFVRGVRGQGRAVLGVFDPDEPAGRQHLLALDVDAVLPSDAALDRFVQVIGALAARGGVSRRTVAVGSVDGTEALGHRASASASPIVVTGLPGAGTSEIALALATSLAAQRHCVLVDAVESSPSLAPRLGLPIEPSLRSAVDAMRDGAASLDRALVAVAPGLRVITGFPGSAAASQVHPSDVAGVVEMLAPMGTTCVDIGADGDIARRVLRDAGTVLLVIPATPIGVARGLGWIARTLPLQVDAPIHVVANRAPRDRFRRTELEQELTRTYEPAAMWWVPTDRRVDDAVWNGRPVARGPFVDAVASIVRAVVGTGTTRRRTRQVSRRHRRAA
jgi:CO dehydrogenase nickel-insertion accessory protein CooC1